VALFACESETLVECGRHWKSKPCGRPITRFSAHLAQHSWLGTGWCSRRICRQLARLQGGQRSQGCAGRSCSPGEVSWTRKSARACASGSARYRGDCIYRMVSCRPGALPEVVRQCEEDQDAPAIDADSGANRSELWKKGIRFCAAPMAGGICSNREASAHAHQGQTCRRISGMES